METVSFLRNKRGKNQAEELMRIDFFPARRQGQEVKDIFKRMTTKTDHV